MNGPTVVIGMLTGIDKQKQISLRFYRILKNLGAGQILPSWTWSSAETNFSSFMVSEISVWDG